VKGRLGIVFYWCCFNTIIFGAVYLIAPWWVACNVSAIITVAAFCDESNWKDRAKLTRPEVWVNGRN